MLGKIAFAEIIVLPLALVIPAAVLYFVIKLAIKHAIKELRDNNII